MHAGKRDLKQFQYGRNCQKAPYTGICAGAPVLTDLGMRTIDSLSRGDSVLTSSGMQQISAIIQLTRVTHAVYIVASSLGHLCKRRDTMLPAGQPALLRDWRAWAFRGTARALIPVGELVDGEYIRSLGQIPLTFYQLSFTVPGVLHADGMELGCATRCPNPGQVSFAPR